MRGDPVVHADVRRILGVQALRALVYGFASVVLGSVLAARGLSGTRAGLLFAAMLAGTALTSILVGIVGERVARRRLYAALLGLMGLAGTVFALTDAFWILAVVALTGTLSTDPNESGPITSLEQAMLGGAPAAERARAFGRYNAIAYLAGALGALAGGGPALLRRWIPSLPADERWLLLFPVVAAASVWLARGLSTRVEARGPASPRALERSRGTVARLAALFGLDALAGGFVVTTFIVFWFERRFDAGVETMGLVLFAAGLLQAGSSIVSGRLAGRIGLLNTMVFTHLPSNVLLVIIPLMPTLELAAVTLLVRFALSQMDVPARQTYVVAMVDPHERIAAAAFTNTSRYLARPFGAAGAGALLQGAGLGAPWVVAGSLKVCYDLLLYATFRNVPLPAGTTATRPPA